MTQYIDKDAIVTEIERLREQDYPCYTFEESTGYYDAIDKIATFLNTLEAKEVDFSMEVYKYIDEHFNVYDDGNQTLQTKDKKSLIGRVDVENIAKYFFELGLKVAHNNS